MDDIYFFSKELAVVQSILLLCERLVSLEVSVFAEIAPHGCGFFVLEKLVNSVGLLGV